MRTSILPVRVFVLALACAAACDSPAEPEQPVMETGPAHVESVEVQVSESAPVRVFAHIEGIVGDGCSTLLPIQPRREGARITVRVERERPRDAVCIQIARTFDETVPLPGDFPPGRYELQVNELEQVFTID